METNEPDSPWKSALEGAELAPSEGVWSAIESDLIMAENARMKRSVILYRRLAAASVLVVFLMGSYMFYYRGAERDTTLTATNDGSGKKVKSDLQQAGKPKDQPVNNAGLASNNRTDKKTDDAVASSDDQNEITKAQRNQSVKPAVADENLSLARVVAKSSGISQDHINNSASSDAVKKADARQRSADAPTNTEIALRAVEGPSGVRGETPALVSSEVGQGNVTEKDMTLQETKFSGTVAIDTTSKNVVVESPLKIKEQEKIALPWEEPRTIVAQSKPNESLWASVGGAAGVYNSGVKSSPLNQALSSASSSKNTVGPAWSFGASVAGKVLPRWVVQGGVNYVNQSIGSTGSSSFAAAPPLANTSIKGYDQAYLAVASGSPTTALTSTLEFISVPMQAGYLVVDRKVGLLLSAGVASNFFVRNSITDQSGQSPAFSTGPGSDSPYRTMSWSGLMTTELSYRLARQYRFALVPGMRYALNSTTKAGGDRPYVMDIGFRVRYNF